MDLATPTRDLIDRWQADWTQRQGFVPHSQRSAFSRMEVLAIRADERELGIIAIDISGWASILDLWLLPHERGRAHAREALAQVENRCRLQGARRIRATIHDHHPAVRALFSRYRLVAEHLKIDTPAIAHIPDWVTCRPIADHELAAWRTEVAEEYARQSGAAHKIDPDIGLVSALRTIDRALPGGVNTAGNELWVLDAAGARAATLWIRFDSRPRQAYIQSLETSPNHRRQGYAQAAIQLAHARARARALPSLRLNVFAHNRAGRRLYEKMGYETATEFRIKHLHP